MKGSAGEKKEEEKKKENQVFPVNRVFVVLSVNTLFFSHQVRDTPTKTQCKLPLRSKVLTARSNRCYQWFRGIKHLSVLFACVGAEGKEYLLRATACIFLENTAANFALS